MKLSWVAVVYVNAVMITYRLLSALCSKYRLVIKQPYLPSPIKCVTVCLNSTCNSKALTTTETLCCRGMNVILYMIMTSQGTPRPLLVSVVKPKNIRRWTNVPRTELMFTLPRVPKTSKLIRTFVGKIKCFFTRQGSLIESSTTYYCTEISNNSTRHVLEIIHIHL